MSIDSRPRQTNQLSNQSSFFPGAVGGGIDTLFAWPFEALLGVGGNPLVTGVPEGSPPPLTPLLLAENPPPEFELLIEPKEFMLVIPGLPMILLGLRDGGGPRLPGLLAKLGVEGWGGLLANDGVDGVPGADGGNGYTTPLALGVEGPNEAVTNGDAG